jgi:hypothetical protein
MIIAQQASFIINGTVSGLQVNTLYFTESSFFNNVKPQVQKLLISDGKFSVKGAFTEPVPVFLSIEPDYKKDPAMATQFILDQGEISVRIKGGLNDVVITGSMAQDDMQRLSLGQEPFFEKLNQIGKEAELKSQSGISPDSIAAQYRIPFQNVNKGLVTYQRSFVKENPKAFPSLLLIPSIAGSTFNFFDFLWTGFACSGFYYSN